MQFESLEHRSWWLAVMVLMVIGSAAACGREELQPSLPQVLVTNSLFDVYFVSDHTGWAVGKLGKIVATADGGAYWETQQGITDNSLRRVYFLNEREGWVAGDRGTILHTKNAGQVWIAQESRTIHHLRDIYFFNSTAGLVVGEQGIVLTTGNGGNTWNERKDLKGLLAVEGSNFPAALFGVFFADSQTGWIAGDYGTILKTTDAGETWKKQESGTADLLMDIYFVGARTGWAVGEFGTIIYTTDGGETWQRQESGTSNLINSITCTDNLNCFVITYGTLLCTHDGGLRWDALLSDKKMWLYGTTSVGKQRIWVACDYGEILHSSDSGEEWISQIPWERQVVSKGGESGLY